MAQEVTIKAFEKNAFNKEYFLLFDLMEVLNEYCNQNVELCEVSTLTHMSEKIQIDK